MRYMIEDLAETVRLLREEPGYLALTLLSVAAFYGVPWLMALAWSASRGLL